MRCSPKAKTRRLLCVLFLRLGAVSAGSGQTGRCETVTARHFPPPWTVEDMAADRPMTAEQAATLKRLAEATYELEAFQPNLTRAEADLRIAMLTAKLKLLDGPPHTL